MRKLLLMALLVGACGPSAFAIEQQATNVTEVKVFRNVSGASTTHGTAFILQDASTDSNVTIGATRGSATSLGMDVTTTTTADSARFIGCQVDDSCGDDQLCRVAVWGPAICRWAGATDDTATRMATVGTTSVAGNLGSGTLAGLTMSLTLSPAGTEDTEIEGVADNELRWIWVQPDNN